MEAYFKRSKSNYDFLSQISECLAHDCKFISQNSDIFFSELRDLNLHLREISQN